MFDDGSEESFDIILFATGYKYCFPFFDLNDKIIEFDDNIDNGNYFGPLYRKMFLIDNPNLMFIGLIERTTLLFLSFERQALLAKQFIVELISKIDLIYLLLFFIF